MKNNILRYGFVLFGVFLLHSCDAYFKNGLKIVMNKNAFDREYLAWERQNIKNYQFVYEYFNDAGPVGPVKITVRENEPTTVESLSPYGDENLTLKSIPDVYIRIKSTFEFIESVKNGTYGGYKINSLTLNITYDPQYHYPKEAVYSEGYEEMVAGGGYYTLRITNFTVLDSN
jgi:hypothetical protein